MRTFSTTGIHKDEKTHIQKSKQDKDEDPVERAESFCTELNVQSLRDCVMNLSKEIMIQRYDKDTLSIEHGIQEQRGSETRFIYASAPNRGLEELLRIWPVIHNRLEHLGNVELHVYYGFTPAFMKWGMSSKSRHAQYIVLKVIYISHVKTHR